MHAYTQVAAARRIPQCRGLRRQSRALASARPALPRRARPRPEQRQRQSPERSTSGMPTAGWRPARINSRKSPRAPARASICFTRDCEMAPLHLAGGQALATKRFNGPGSFSRIAHKCDFNSRFAGGLYFAGELMGRTDIFAIRHHHRSTTFDTT